MNNNDAEKFYRAIDRNGDYDEPRIEFGEAGVLVGLSEITDQLNEYWNKIENARTTSERQAKEKACELMGTHCKCTPGELCVCCRYRRKIAAALLEASTPARAKGDNKSKAENLDEFIEQVRNTGNKPL